MVSYNIMRIPLTKYGLPQVVLIPAGLLGLICRVYLILHLATRGYYVWMLRGGVVVVILIVVVVILKLSA